MEVRPSVQVARLPIAGSGNFGSRGFQTAQKMRLELIARWIEAHTGGVILVSDIDIQYMRPFAAEMIGQLGDADLAFQRETAAGGANLGQMVIRCTAATHDFLQAVLDEYLRTGEWEQGIVNRLLGSRRMSFRLLPASFANTKTGFQPGMHSYHAIKTAARAGQSSIELKRQQFQELAIFLQRHPSEALSPVVSPTLGG